MSKSNCTKSIQTLNQEIMIEIEEFSISKTINTGFSSFENKYGSLNTSELLLIGGRPGIGKTQFALLMTMKISSEFGTLFITLELSSLQLTKRMLFINSGISVSRLNSNNLSEKQLLHLKKTSDYIRNQLFINDSVNPTIEDIKNTIIITNTKFNIKVVFIDYIQLISTDESERGLSMKLVVNELKKLAKELNICIIGLSQLPRVVELREAKIPMLSDLDSSEEADKVWFIYRPEYYSIEDDDGIATENVVKIIVAKNDNEIGEYKFIKNNNFTLITD